MQVDGQPACAGSEVDPEWFYILDDFNYPDMPNMERRELNRRNNRQAVRICKRCPLAQECLEQNLDDPHGIYGGLLPKQRKAILAERGLELAPPPAVDEIAVDLVLQGREDVRLSRADRSEVVRRMAKLGASSKEIRRAARVNWTKYRDIKQTLAADAA
jgi:hypothetical protein